MCPLQCKIAISLLLFHVSYCQRRIVNGDMPALDQTFMVYFVKASVSPEDYDEWVCGGALITTDLIMTSAACVEDVKYMYAVAGYNKYVSDAAIDSDPCTSSKMKKKVIMTCVPKYILCKPPLVSLKGYQVERALAFKTIFNQISKEEKVLNSSVIFVYFYKIKRRRLDRKKNLYTFDRVYFLVGPIVTWLWNPGGIQGGLTAYELDYGKLEKWSFIDIAVAQVESPYKEDEVVSQCSYSPKPVQVNFEEKYQSPSTDAMVLGWGHKEKWRREDDLNTYNSEDLLAASVTLADKDECKKEYTSYPGMETVIDKYMICSIGPGNIDSKGEILVTSAPSADGCAMINGRRSKTCDDTSSDLVLVENIRRKNLNNMTFTEIFKNNTKINIKSENINNNTKAENYSKNNTKIENGMKYNTNTENGSQHNKKVANHTKLSEKAKKLFKVDTNNTIPFRFMNTRRQGICQNDHGGPIVTWAGGHEILIGIASVFKIAADYKCEGPFLYTSTQCNGAFLNCIMTHTSSEYAQASRKGTVSDDEESRRKFCDSAPEVKGFKMVKKHISWMDHPDGPSEIDLQLNKTSNLHLNTDKTLEMEHKINKTSTTNLNINSTSVTDHKLNITPTHGIITESNSKTDIYLNVTATRSSSQFITSTTSSKLQLIDLNKSTITSTASPESNVFQF